MAASLSCLDRFLCYFLLIPTRRPSQLLDDFAVAIARVKVHGGIDICRITTQDVLHPADVFKEGFPVLDRQSAQAEDTIGDNSLFCQFLRRGRCDGEDFSAVGCLQSCDVRDSLSQVLQESDAQHGRQGP